MDDSNASEVTLREIERLGKEAHGKLLASASASEKKFGETGAFVRRFASDDASLAINPEHDAVQIDLHLIAGQRLSILMFPPDRTHTMRVSLRDSRRPKVDLAVTFRKNGTVDQKDWHPQNGYNFARTIPARYAELIVSTLSSI